MVNGQDSPFAEFPSPPDTGASDVLADGFPWWVITPDMLDAAAREVGRRERLSPTGGRARGTAEAAIRAAFHARMQSVNPPESEAAE